MSEVVVKILEKMESLSVTELNALIAINYAEWCKNGDGIDNWNPAGNPLHAHDIIDKLLADDLFVNLFGRPEEWTCEIIDSKAAVYAEVTRTTMARAICEAALITILTKYGDMIKV